MKFVTGNGQYVVHANNGQEASEILLQEFQRIDEIKEKVANLLSQDGSAIQNFMTNTAEQNLQIEFDDESSLIFDNPDNATTKGEVIQQKDGNRVITNEKGEYLYRLAYRYPEINGVDANFRLAHEMGHLVLNPANAQRQGYDKTSNSRQVAGLIRRDENSGQLYGSEMQENAINLIAQLAIRGKHSADDIIMGRVDLSEFNSYKRCDDLVKLLAVSMRNDFDNEISFEQLAESKIDSLITLSDGTQVPANTFFYGMVNDSSMIQNEFDKYMGEGAWRQINNAFEQLYKGNISQERFDIIFQSTQDMIQEFANVRFQDKYKEAVVRNGDFNIPNLESKLQMIAEITGVTNERTNNETQAINTEQDRGFTINEFGEIIRPARTEETNQFQSQQAQEQGYTNTRFGTVINSNSYSEHLQPISQQNDNKLSLKQKIAQFMQKNNILMNLPFVENFVNRQLNVLPASSQERTVSTGRQTREDFLNMLSNNGEYRNLPPIQRMSDPERIARMQRKMEQSQQSTDENERG